MGRLTKTKVDEIAKLRKQGYTQKETAEKVNVHLLTVRKYDPLKQNRSCGERHKTFADIFKGSVSECFCFRYGNGR